MQSKTIELFLSLTLSASLSTVALAKDPIFSEETTSQGQQTEELSQSQGGEAGETDDASNEINDDQGGEAGETDDASDEVNDDQGGEAGETDDASNEVNDDQGGEAGEGGEGGEG